MNFLQYLHIIDSNGENHYILPWKKQTLNSISVDKIIRGASDAFSTLDWYVTKNYLAADNYHLTGIFDINAKKLDVKNFTFTINSSTNESLSLQSDSEKIGITKNIENSSSYITSIQTNCCIYTDKISTGEVYNSNLYLTDGSLNSFMTVTDGNINNLSVYKTCTVNIQQIFSNMNIDRSVSTNNGFEFRGTYYLKFTNLSSLSYHLYVSIKGAQGSTEMEGDIDAYSSSNLQGIYDIITEYNSDFDISQMVFYVWPRGLNKTDESALFIKYMDWKDDGGTLYNNKDLTQFVPIKLDY